MTATRYVLGLSGGRDSAALAVYMRQNHPELEIDYFFTDTGKELPEVYKYLIQLEGFLGKPIEYLNPDRDFDFWLKQYKNFLPSPQSRWCTRQLKLRPFEQWIKPLLNQGLKVVSLVAIRSDEDYREGYSSTHANLTVKLPFRNEGVDRNGVLEILDASGLGLPDYYRWRSRSGCTFCFFQQKIEWVRLIDEHPDKFEEAMNYEKTAVAHGSPFTWSQGESLEQLATEDRKKEIREEYDRRVARLLSKKQQNPLKYHQIGIDNDELFGSSKGCALCHK